MKTFMLFLLLLWTSVYGLTVEFESTQSLLTNHDENVILGILSACSYSRRDHLDKLVHLLQNEYAKIDHIYNEGCAFWSVERYKAICKYAKSHPVSRVKDLLLNRRCLHAVDPTGSVQRRLVSQKVFSAIPIMFEGFDPTTWSHVLQNSDVGYYPSWCVFIPYDVIQESNLDDVDLPAIFTSRCLIGNYPRYDYLMEKLRGQVKDAPSESLARLLLQLLYATERTTTERVTIERITTEQVSSLRNMVKASICAKKDSSLLDMAMKEYLSCFPRGGKIHSHVKCALEQYQSLSDDTKVVLIRLLLEQSPVKVVIRVLESIDVSVKNASYGTSISGLLSFATKLPSYAEARRLFTAIGLDYDDELMYAPNGLWVSCRHHSDLPRSLKWSYFRRNFMLVGTELPGFIYIDDKTYSLGLTYELLRDNFDQIVDDECNFINIRAAVSGSRQVYVRPRIWSTGKLKDLLIVLIFSHIRFNKPFGVLTNNYCKALYGDPDYLGRLIHEDLVFLRRQPNRSELWGDRPLRFSEFALEARDVLKEHAIIFSELMRHWSLNKVFTKENLCSILSG